MKNRPTDYEFNPRATNALHSPRPRRLIGRQQKRWLSLILALLIIMFVCVIFAAEYSYQFGG